MNERDVVFVSKDELGNTVMDMPITNLRNIEPTSDVVEEISDTDELPVYVGGVAKRIAVKDVKSFFGGGGDTPIEYEQFINYTFLYDEGDECAAITGGWKAPALYQYSYFDMHWNDTNGKSVRTKKEKSLYLQAANLTAGQVEQASFLTKNKIDLTGYSQLVTCFKQKSGSGISNWVTERDMENIGQNYSGYNKITAVRRTDLAIVDNLNLNSAYIGVSIIVYHASQLLTATAEIKNVLIVKDDNFSEWAGKAGITATDIDTLVADEASMTALMNSEDAIKFMTKQCTGTAMIAVLQSDVGKAALEASPYLVEVIANEHWAKFIMMLAPELLNYTMLYDHGDECTDVTGGWTTSGYSSNYTIQAATKGAGYIEVAAGTSSYISMLGTEKVIPFADKDYSMILGVCKSNTTNTYSLRLSSPSNANSKNFSPTAYNLDLLFNKTVKELKISGVQKVNRYILVNAAEYAGGGYLYAVAVAKQDEWKKLCEIAEIDSSTLTEANLIANSVLMVNVLANEGAVDYLCGCTGTLMARIVASNVAVNAIVGSAYATAKLTNHPVWKKFIKMSPVCESAGLTAIL